MYGNNKFDIRAEIYSIGVTMYYMATGLTLAGFPYEMRVYCKTKNNLPKRLENVILKCAEPVVENRYQSFDELMTALNQCLNIQEKKSLNIEAKKSYNIQAKKSYNLKSLLRRNKQK